MKARSRKDLRNGAYSVFIYQSQKEHSAILAEYLEYLGFKVTTADDYDCMAKIDVTPSHVYILDHYPNGLKSYAGLDPLLKLRDVNSEAGIIMLSSRKDIDSKLRAFKEGADDYVVAPCNFDELAYRIKSLGVRTGMPTMPNKSQYQLGIYLFSPRGNVIEGGNVGLTFLTPHESLALELMAYNIGELVTYKELHLYLFGSDDNSHLRYMASIMTKLRKYMSEDWRIRILNTEGNGYTLFIEDADINNDASLL